MKITTCKVQKNKTRLHGERVALNTYNKNMVRVLAKRVIQKGAKYYNKIACGIVPNERFIYFALQYEPEASTMARAGIFKEQILSIQILAKALESYDIKLYVKEHIVQYRRDKSFYNDILKIPNVRLIKTTENVYELINNCVAVSTQTGTCMFEGILRNKPAIVFSNGYWSSAPGIFYTNDVESCVKAINLILEQKYIINDTLLKRYFYAMDKTFIHTYLDPDDIPNLTVKITDSINELSEFINNSFNLRILEEEMY